MAVDMAPPPVPEKASEPSEWEKDINISLICRECRNIPPNVVEEFSSGDMVCGDCGLVLGDRIIDTRSEWRTFSNDDQNNDDPSRVGDAPNPLLNGNQLSTEISFGAGGAAARDLHRTQNKANLDKATKTLLSAYREIGELCDAWNLPKNLSDTAKHLYKKVNDAGTFRGKSQDSIIAGILFISCRQCKVHRSFREIHSLTKVSKKEIGKIFKLLETFFKKENAEKEKEQAARGHAINTQELYQAAEATTAANLLARYTNMLGLDVTIQNVAEDVAKRMDARGILAGRSPLSQCAASLYFASHLMGQGKSSMEISKALGISDGTIRTVYKHLYQAKDELVDEKWIKPKGRGNKDDLPAV